MRNLLFTVLIFSYSSLIAQKATVQGVIKGSGNPIEMVAVQLHGNGQSFGAYTDEDGSYTLENIPYGSYQLHIQLIGYISIEESLNVDEPMETLNFTLQEDWLDLEQVVITGTRTSKKITRSPVMVNLIDKETLRNVQACNLSEGLRFQPGLRVETDCQTCNYTQLRMNGLQGGYSQILINGRPIFSPLTGLYGMEQIPANMIERIEVVRGGGSALYGSGAIGGTVNIITRLPQSNSYDIGYTYQNISGAADHQILGNATAINTSGTAGATFFVNKRSREWYDHNNDNFSELPSLENNSFGANFFFQPTDHQKLEASISSLNEYRYGGEMTEGPAHLAQQSEERTHRVLMANVDYQINFNDDNSSFIAYLAGQHTGRDHFTGILPDDSVDLVNYLADPPYGTSEVITLQGGLQINHCFTNFFGTDNVITFGGEYIDDRVNDVIEAYNYLIDQETKNLGLFLQSDWEISNQLSLLSGLRMDQHNLVDNIILSPRVSFMYRPRPNTQFRFTYSTGFRAPQAFDTDLHIAFAGGGVSRVFLDPDLVEERSQSLSASINYDRAVEKFVAGFTLEGFHTFLRNAFYLESVGEDNFGEVFMKQNNPGGATVQGATLELRANYNQYFKLEGGYTIQSSLYEDPVVNIDGLEARKEFLRTPDHYGYATLSFLPDRKFNTAINLVYTGPMLLTHFAGAPEQTEDAYKTSDPFTELGFRSSYTFELPGIDTGLELFGGIKNITNAYQNDFDSGKNRDSNFVYGPAAPRTYFIGLRIKSL